MLTAAIAQLFAELSRRALACVLRVMMKLLVQRALKSQELFDKAELFFRHLGHIGHLVFHRVRHLSIRFPGRPSLMCSLQDILCGTWKPTSGRFGAEAELRPLCEPIRPPAGPSRLLTGLQPGVC